MATDLIQQSDVDEQNKQQTAAAKPKYDQFSALQNGFQQNQTAAAGKPLQNAYVVGAQQSVTGNQNVKNADTVQQGQQTAAGLTGQADAFNQTQGYTPFNFQSAGTQTGLDSATTDPAAGQTVPTSFDLDATNAALAGAYNTAQSDYGTRLTAAQNAAQSANTGIGVQETSNQNALNTLGDTINTGLTTAQQKQGMADVGPTNGLESQSAGVNQVFADPNASGTAKLAALFGPNYNTGRYGAQDSQVYGQQLADLSDQAKASNHAANSALAGKTAALQNYQNSLSTAGDTVADTLAKKSAAIASGADQARQTTQAGLDQASKDYDLGKLTSEYNDKLSQAATNKAKEDQRVTDYPAEQQAYANSAATAGLQNGDLARAFSSFGGTKAQAPVKKKSGYSTTVSNQGRR